MREIKFRAWDGDRMHRAFDLTQNPLYWWEDNFDFPLMQFTGLTDKNGVEIYEGDIVDVPYGKPVNEDGDVAYYKIMQQVPAVITYNPPFFYPRLVWSKKTIAKNIPSKRQSLWQKERCEVIGNIYENPELLEHSNA